ncbi:methyltransferase domain-containing protein [Phaeosphaeria sp. MPI-PUGE-AT-0046c]|nr:methyltransferase domain-containing protein [Phaeosphaeria sp. MPI-PUGE-AT-0046c]
MSETVPENLKARVKASYDAIADAYAERFTKEDDPVRLRYIRHLIEHFRKEATSVNVLELGCGSGIPATKYMLQNESPKITVTGNDISTAQLKLARSNLAAYKDRVTLLENDMLGLDFPSTTFDAVTGFYSIIHLPREEQTQLMKKVFAWLKPGGYFLANFAVEEAATHEIKDWMQHEKGWMFWSGWGTEGSLKMVEELGMEVLLQEELEEVADATFLWILARKPT